MPAPITTPTTARARLPRTLAGLASHPWVQSIDDGRATGDNLHIYLRPGFVWAGTSSAVIEPTVWEACQAFREVRWDPAAWGQSCGASAAEVATLTGETTPSIADRIGAALRAIDAIDRVTPPTVCQLRADAAEGRPVSLAQLARSIAAHAAPRPVLPGEAAPSPAPSHGDRTPRLPEVCPEA